MRISIPMWDIADIGEDPLSSVSVVPVVVPMVVPMVVSMVLLHISSPASEEHELHTKSSIKGFAVLSQKSPKSISKLVSYTCLLLNASAQFERSIEHVEESHVPMRTVLQ